MVQKCLRDPIRFIKPLHVLLNIFALVPPYTVNRNYKPLGYQRYTLLVSLLVSCVYIWTLYIREGDIIKTLLTFNSFIAVYTITTAFWIISILVAAFYNVKYFAIFLPRLSNSYKILGHLPNSPSLFFIQLLLVHLMYLGIIIFNGTVSIPITGIYISIGLLLKGFENYLNGIMSLLIYNYCSILKQRFEQLNEFLDNSTRSYLEQNNYSKQFQVFHNNHTKNDKQYEVILNKFHLTRKVFTELCDLVTLFNKIFGWNITFAFVVMFLTMLYMLTWIIVGYHNFNMGIMFFLWTVAVSIMGTLVAVICDMTRKEALRTATVCYNLLLDVPADSENVLDQSLRNELILLAEQATHQCPHFSAAGFFNVDCRILFGLIGSLTSYVIVLVQFSK